MKLITSAFTPYSLSSNRSRATRFRKTNDVWLVEIDFYFRKQRKNHHTCCISPSPAVDILRFVRISARLFICILQRRWVVYRVVGWIRNRVFLSHSIKWLIYSAPSSNSSICFSLTLWCHIRSHQRSRNEKCDAHSTIYKHSKRPNSCTH